MGNMCVKDKCTKRWVNRLLSQRAARAWMRKVSPKPPSWEQGSGQSPLHSLRARPQLPRATKDGTEDVFFSFRTLYLLCLEHSGPSCVTSTSLESESSR